jgi:NodT family efflux transporter outer membrane factor (OMF) lipoprotein
MRRSVVFSFCLCLLTGCALGPNYKRPDAHTPVQFRQPAPVPPVDKNSLADLNFADLFHDETITTLVKTALKQSYDLQASTERVLEARAQLGVTSSQLFPQLSASAAYTATRDSSVGAFNIVPPGTNFSATYTQAGLNLSWEIDLWGRLRRLTESARAQYLAQEDARHAVVASLIANVITTYLDLLELDLELRIGQSTKDLAERGLAITRLRKARGLAAGLDIRQAEELLYTATSQIVATQRAITDTENMLSVLLGQYPGEIPRGKPLIEFTDPVQLPAGLPSALLEQRPDIQQAEQNLVAANAQIGAAKALFFPQITLTGFLGLQSRALTNLFTGNARQQDFGPAAVLPIFTAGQLRNNLRLTEAQQREAIDNYRKVIQTAFQEVSDALSDYQKNREQRAQEELFVNALQDASRLSVLRYRGGLDSYLQVLDAQRNEFSGELTLAQLRRDELLSIVQLYLALGGGWQNI